MSGSSVAVAALCFYVTMNSQFFQQLLPDTPKLVLNSHSYTVQSFPSSSSSWEEGRAEEENEMGTEKDEMLVKCYAKFKHV